MLLAIDVREACRPQKTGKGRWTFHCVEELLRRHLDLLLLTDAPLPSSWSSRVRSENVITFSPGWTWHLRVARFLRLRSDIDLVVCPTSYIVAALVGRSLPVAPVVHDLIAFRGEPHDRKATLIERWTLGPAVRSASIVYVVSESTKEDLLERFPSLPADRIATIYAGPLRPDPPVWQGDGEYILCVGTLCPRKNQERLVRAYHLLPPALKKAYRLVLAGGRGWNDQMIVDLASGQYGVEWRGYVDDAAYDDLLTHCSMLALPSLYEGFGMQVLDALQRGIPQLLSQRGSLPEVAGDHAVYADPEDVADIATKLEQMLADTEGTKRMGREGMERAKHFTWKRTVDLLLDAVGLSL